MAGGGTGRRWALGGSAVMVAGLVGVPLSTGMLSRLDVAELASRLPAEMSLGQCQRVAIARALVVGPAVVLVDEPTSHQDADHTARILAELRASTGAGCAVLVATHDPTVISAADDVVDLDST